MIQQRRRVAAGHILLNMIQDVLIRLDIQATDVFDGVCNRADCRLWADIAHNRVNGLRVSALSPKAVQGREEQPRAPGRSFAGSSQVRKAIETAALLSLCGAACAGQRVVR